MQIKIFTIPVVSNDYELEELNLFLRSLGFSVGRPPNTFSIAKEKVLRGLVANGGLNPSFVVNTIYVFILLSLL